MISKPMYNPMYEVVVVHNEAIYFVSESKEVIFDQNVFMKIGPMINGIRTIDEIVDNLAGIIPLTEIYYAIMLWSNDGYLIESHECDMSSREMAFWSSLDLEHITAQHKLKNKKVDIFSYGNLNAEEIIPIISKNGITMSSSSDINVVLVDDYLHNELEAFNERSLRINRPWLLAKPVGNLLWIGPIIIPGVTACYECLAHRLKTNRSAFYAIQKKAPGQILSSSLCGLNSSINTGLNMIVTELAKALVLEKSHKLIGKIMTYDINSYQTQFHNVTKRPQCIKCGNQSTIKPIPIKLSSNMKQSSLEIGHRSETYEETLCKMEHLISPITGIIQNVEKSSFDDLMYVYSAGQNLAMQQSEYRMNIESNRDNQTKSTLHLRSLSGGKGTSDLQAKVGAVCEAVERYSGVYRGDEYTLQATFNELGESAIHPHTCMNFSDYQYKHRDVLNNNKKWAHIIPNPFELDCIIKWSPVWSLTHSLYKYLPTSFCYYGFADSEDHVFCIGNSNGSAAGNTMEEAIFHGLMELVERDAVSIWWYNEIKRPVVDLESFDMKYVRKIEQYYKSIDRDLWVLDITHDLGIPTFAAVSRNKYDTVEDLTFGFGTHLDPKVALTRAITELNQFQVLVPLKRTSNFDSEVTHWWNQAKIKDHQYLEPDWNLESIKVDTYSKQWSDNIDEDIIYCKKLIENKGLEILVLDQTRPDLNLPVVKVIVPGMRHFWNSFAPGRLYEVPVQMGWLNQAKSEKELNPVTLFI